ncbi:MAG: ATP-binding protein [Candidatus Methylacidiphilales bacterium]|nr:ATP-binding protein [Candidatus Methylacidiphilales bacterium]
MRSTITSLKRSLMLRLLVLLVVLAALLIYSNRAMIGVIEEGRQSMEIINAAGRQRMLVQQFVRQANLALVGLSISDWETLLEQRKLSAETSEQFERSMKALLEGGTTKLGSVTVSLPRVDAPDIHSSLEEIAALWNEVKRASVRVLRSQKSQLHDHPDLALMQQAAMRLVAKVDNMLLLMQKLELQRSNWLIFYQNAIVAGGLGVFVLLALFVYRRIVSPLADTILKLDQSEIQLRNLYDAAPVGLWQAELSEGHLLKTNVAMARLLGCMQERGGGCGSTRSIFSLMPENAALFRSAITSQGEVTDFETTCPDPDGGQKTLLISARHYANKAIAEGAVTDITARKRAEAKLEALHRQLVDTSRQAGMAEVATSVLHNVGNVLNSVNVSSSLVTTQLKNTKAGNLTKIVTMLQSHSSDLGSYLTADPKGRQIPGYLGQLAEQLARERDSALQELAQLQENIDHIKDIVAMQQNYAKISGIVETIKLSELIEDALRLNLGALQRHGVELFRDYGEVPPMDVEKHKILQILVNLVRNAKYACDESLRTDKRMTLRLARNDEWVYISVIDNGVGIPEENLTRIFNHGFTTRKDGHGFGLHNAALAAVEMGGALTVRSDGSDKGATFTLALPYKPGASASLSNMNSDLLSPSLKREPLASI